MNDLNRDITINDLISKFKLYNNNEEDIDLINRAYDYAYKKHFGVKRISGDDYYHTPIKCSNDSNRHLMQMQIVWLQLYYMIL